MFELHKRQIKAVSQIQLPITYESVRIDAGCRIDLLVKDAVIVELKAVETLSPIHKAQLLSYLNLSGEKLGLLINFNTVHLKDGIVRLVNNL